MLTLKDAIPSKSLNVRAFKADDPHQVAKELRVWLDEGNDPIHDIAFLQDEGKTIAIVVYRGNVR